MTLKQFKGPKSLDAINAQCIEQGLILRRNRHDAFKSDFVVVSSPLAPTAEVFYNTVSGWFFGTTPTGESFDSREPLDDQPWFAALLEFFNEALDATDASAAAAPCSCLNLGELAFEDGQAAVTRPIQAGDSGVNVQQETAK